MVGGVNERGSKRVKPIKAITKDQGDGGDEEGRTREVLTSTSTGILP